MLFCQSTFCHRRNNLDATGANQSQRPIQLARKRNLLLFVVSFPEQTDEYGRADQHTVEFLIGYINPNEVYGNTPLYWTVTYCKYILGSNDYSLADNYTELLWRTTEKIAMPEKEIIFPVLADGNTTQSYGIGAIIVGSRSSSEGTVVNYGCNGGWDGFRSTGNLIRAFEYEAEESAWTADNLNSHDNRAIFYSTGTFIGYQNLIYRYIYHRRLVGI